MSARGVGSVVTLAPPRADAGVDVEALLATPQTAHHLPTETAVALLGPVAALYAHLQARVAAGGARDASVSPVDSSAGLLTAVQVAERLCVSTDWVYRRTRSLPFAVRIGGHVRFSADGLASYVKNRRA